MTAFSDETGREQAFERFPKLAGWIERLAGTQMDLSLKEWGEFLAELNVALSAAPVETITVPFNPCLAKLRDGEPFFVLIGRDKQAPNAVMTWARDREAAEGPSPWVEQAREVAATMAAYSGAAPVAQEPVARLCGYCKTWNSKPCGEQCCLQPSDPVWTSPPATPAGVGADEIAQIIATKCFDPRVIDSSGKPFWKKSQWREAQQAANAILLLLSGGRSEQDGSR